MSAKAAGFLLIVAAVVLESVAQICMKLGAGRRGVGGGIQPARPAVGPYLGAAVALYIVEIVFYTLALQRLEVSVAFPLASLSFVGVAVLSRFVLGEAVGGSRMLGVVCIVTGAFLVARL